MSSGYYNDADEGQRRRAPRGSRPMYQEKEEIIEKRGGAAKNRHTEMIRRPSSSDGSGDDMRRSYPPPGDGYVKRRTVKREYEKGGGGGGRRRAKSADYSSDSEDDHYRGAPRGGGGRRDRNRGGRGGRYPSESESYSDSPPRRKQESRKSAVEQALAAAGIGGTAAKAISSLAGGGKDKGHDERTGRPRSRSQAGSRRGSASPDRSRSAGANDMRGKMLQAGKAALLAGGTEAWRMRKEPGGLGGNVQRIATAALGAAGINKALDRDPDKSGTRHTIESALGGIMGNRLLNGRRESRSRSKSRDGRSQSKSGLGIGGLASAAGVAALGAKAYSNYRKRSQNRDRGGDMSDSSSGSARSGRSGRSSRKGGKVKGAIRERSRSVSRFVNAGLAKLGLDDPRKTEANNRRNGDYSDDEDSYGPRPRGGELAAQNKINDKGEKEKKGTSTDSYSSTDEEKKRKKMRGKEMLTAGLATVATIHAAHQIYSSVEKRKLRRKEVEEGKMDPETAKKLRNRARVKDAASVGIAAIGIKHAFSEWKEMREQSHEFHEHERRLQEMRDHRKAKRVQMEEQHRQLQMQSVPLPQPGNGQQYDNGPQYNQGGNPYATAVPPPPMGQSPRY